MSPGHCCCAWVRCNSEFRAATSAWSGVRVQSTAATVVVAKIDRIMLRLFFVALLLANLALAAWMQGWLSAVLAAPGQGEREPQRMARQVNPELVRLFPSQAGAAAPAAGNAASNPIDSSLNEGAPAFAPGSAASSVKSTTPASATDAVALASAAVTCLEAGPFSAADLTAAEAAIRSAQVPGVVLRSVKIERGGEFLVYLGKFPNRGAMLTRLVELKRAAISGDEVRGAPALEPGLDFGRFKSRAAADAAQAQLVRRGLQNTRVVVIKPPVSTTLLRVDKADGPQAERLGAIQLTPVGAGFSACATGERG